MIDGVPPNTGHLRTYRVREHTIVEFHGDIDIEAALTIGPYLYAVTTPPETLLVIDLTPVTFFDCSGLALLCRTDRRLQERGGELLLVCPHPLTLRILRVLRLTERFSPTRTLDDALRERSPARE
ncbi:STAS domain-containing protein [Streptomyces sp. TRM66268-LWL]|uniref:Anti-sigma factor antagonist n=1 Tax=Streptomyces polyasparticus TaxID=2767826 RepID=A0ABR7S7Q0_9ACTN|nr:STAS domain-containing protein [Streptomyces polyasparticus]MBC9711495.1 STAS domain-containing protein [Streptomyces polyasparticus]